MKTMKSFDRADAPGKCTTDILYVTACIVGILLLAGSVLAYAFGAEMSGFQSGTHSGLIWMLTALLTVLFTLRALLWWKYKPVGSTNDSELPSITVVIPVFNEGAGVRASIESVMRSNYPHHLIHLVVVDDGSSDDTWFHIGRACAPFADRVSTVRLDNNRGKRHALFQGFSLAEGEVVVTLDSDSNLRPESLRHLVAPLVRNERVGAVAGKVLVRNRRESLMSRMLGVRYILGFDFVRAYQSELKTVWCCPGALQAYRREVIVSQLIQWRDQRFLGAQCTNGDDHAMTNRVLRLGYDSVYQSTATVETVVPQTYRQLTRMFTRWGSSATREGLIALSFAPRRSVELGGFRGLFMLVDALLQPLTILLRVLFLGAGIFLAIHQPLALASAAAFAGLFALVYAAIFLRSERSREWIFCVCYAYFALIALAWVQPYATITVRGNKWLTRG